MCESIMLLTILIVYISMFFGLLNCPRIGMIVWAIAYIGVMYISYSIAAELLRIGSRIIDYAYIPGFFPAAGFIACLIKSLIDMVIPKKRLRSKEKRVPCPHCEEQILPRATKCPFCRKEVKENHDS